MCVVINFLPTQRGKRDRGEGRGGVDKEREVEGCSLIIAWFWHHLGNLNVT